MILESSASKEFLAYLDEIISRYAKDVKKNNDEEIHMRCPICGDSKKSLSKARGHYYKKTGTYYCFNCGEFMSGIKFASFVSGIEEKIILSEFSRNNINGFISELSGDNSSIFEQHINLDPPGIVYPNTRDLNEKEISYLSYRRVTELQFFKELDFNGITAKQGDFLFIPWYWNKKLLNYQIHNYMKYKLIPKYLFSKKGMKPIFGLGRIDNSFKTIVVFEGVFDSLFVKNGISVGGKTLTKFQEYILSTFYNDYEIVLALDQDKPGMGSMTKFAKRGTNQFKFFMPSLDGCKDINEFVIKTKIDLNEVSSIDFVKNNTISDIELLEKTYNI